ncbi:MAG: hypothetical protein ABIL09_30125 [Gemmatimonadota bacterium]
MIRLPQAVMSCVLLIAAPAVASEPSDAPSADEAEPYWSRTLQQRIHENQRAWIAPFAISTAVGLTPLAMQGIDWLAHRRCAPGSAQCYRDLGGYGHFFLAPVTIYTLGLAWSGILASELTLSRMKGDIDEASGPAVLALEWRRRARRHGIASAIVGGVCAVFSVTWLAIDPSSVLYDLYLIWPPMLGISMSMLHVAFTYIDLAREAEAVSGGVRTQRSDHRPGVARISPLGVTVVW